MNTIPTLYLEVNQNEEKIQKYMAELFHSFKYMQTSKNAKKFWDLIVLTTFDQEQKNCFEKQIEEFMSVYQILKGKMYVVADPPNRKLGCGGSTLHVLQTLSEKFGSDLYGKQILIIHSGGISQRLPSYTVQGKIFSPVPIKGFLSGSKVGLMLHLKLAMYLPFCQFLRPGVFVTCGDDIETFYMDPSKVDYEALKNADVVALAHPTDLKTATGHGVYILPNTVPSVKDCVCVSDCVEVLQKPSIALMREKNAIFKINDSKEEMVYMDSVFWMSENVYRPLLSWYVESPLKSELDAYGHFLPCLGLNAKKCHPQQFSDYKAELLPILKDFNLKLIVLNVSNFYHLGTMEEYLSNFTDCPAFCRELNLIKNTSNTLLPCSQVNGQEEDKSLVICCYLLDNVQFKMDSGSQLVAEYCVVEIPVYVRNNLILSNCTLKKCSNIEYLENPVSFFENFLYHTIPLRFKGTLMYVTVAFQISSDLKKIHEDSSCIRIANVPLDQVLLLGQIREVDAFADSNNSFSLWNLRLFRGSLSQEESFWKTHNFINRILHWRDGNPMQTCLTLDETDFFFSMNEIMNYKDLDTFLCDRKKLNELVINSSHLPNGNT